MDDSFHIYVGSETGLFKAIDLSKKTWVNINKPSGEDRKTVLNERQIEILRWSDSHEEQVYLGLTNQTVCIYDVTNRDFIQTHCFGSSIDNDTLVGLDRFQEDFITCTKLGGVRLWDANDQSECKIHINAGQHLECMQQNKTQPNLVATGGKENDLKIWDLNNPKEPIFKAKQVRSDMLQLEVPVWVTDIAFLPDSNKVLYCSGHHQIRMYDPSQQRRPVIDMVWDEYPIKALALRPNGYHAFVGNSRGDMALVDLRGKAYVVQKYKGGAGSIRAIQCHPSLDIVASCGLDRYLRIHDINSKKLLQKFYLKSKLNCLLFSSQTYGDHVDETATSKKDKTNIESGDCGEDSDDNIWDEIETVKTKKRKSDNRVPGKHKIIKTDELDSRSDSGAESDNI